MIYNILVAPFVDLDFMRRALTGVVVLAFGIAPVGVFLMLRRMSLMGDAMSHAILPGVAAGFLLSGLNRIAMTIGGLIAGLVVAMFSGAIARLTDKREDSSLAVFFLVSLALGVAVISSHGTDIDLLEILFGNVKSLDTTAVWLIAVNTALTLITLAVIFRPLVIECVDPVFMRAAGRAGAIAYFAFIVLVVINLISGFLALGTLLAVGLMVLPAGIAKFWSREVAGLILIAVASAILSGYLGLVLSFKTGVPAGPAIVLVGGAIYFLSLFVGASGGILWRFFPRRHLEA